MEKEQNNYNYKFENSNYTGNYTACFHELNLTKTTTSFITIRLTKG